MKTKLFKEYKFWPIDFLLLASQVLILATGLSPILIAAHEFVLTGGSNSKFYLLNFMADFFGLEAEALIISGVFISMMILMSLSMCQSKS